MGIPKSKGKKGTIIAAVMGVFCFPDAEGKDHRRYYHGDNSKIGAGSVVTNSVPPHATVVGITEPVVEIRYPDNATVEKLPDPVWQKLQYLEAEIAELEKRLADLERARFSEETRAVVDPPSEEAKDEGI